MPEALKISDDNIKVNLMMYDTMKTQLDVTKAFKQSVSAHLSKVNSNLNIAGKAFAKNLNTKSLGDKLGDVFNKKLKSLANPFKGISAKIGSAFTGIKKSISKFSPLKSIKEKAKNVVSNFHPIESIKEKAKNVLKKPINTVKTLLGKNDEQLKKKFFRNWYNPKKVAKIFNNISGGGGKLGKNSKGGGGGGLGDASGIEDIFSGISSLLKTLNVSVSIIAASVAWFFSGGGAGIAIAIGITPLVVLLGIMFFMLFNKLDPIIDSITNKILPIIESIGNTLLNFVTNPAHFITQMTTGLVTGLIDAIDVIISKIKEKFGGTIKLAAEGLKMAASGMKEGLSSAFNSGKKYLGDAKEYIGGKINDFMNSKMTNKTETVVSDSKYMPILQSIKDYLYLNKLGLAIVKSLAGPAIDKVANKMSSFMKKAKEVASPALEKVANKMTSFMKKAHEQFETLGPSISSNISSGLNTAFNGMRSITRHVRNAFDSVGDVAAIFKNKIKNALEQKLQTNVASNTVPDVNNPFDEIIKSFEQMRKDTVQLLQSIEKSVISIEKNKIKIGENVTENKAEISDTKNANNLQSISVNSVFDVDSIVNKITETNNILNGILTNTSLNDSGEKISNAVWSI